VAAAAYADLTSWRSNVSRVMVLSPAHFTPLHGMAIPSVGAFATPFGPVPVDADARTVAAGLSAVVVDDEPHASEHAIETQLPFLIRTLGPGVPVLGLGCCWAHLTLVGPSHAGWAASAGFWV
jgi:MEMO1 family protein